MGARRGHRLTSPAGPHPPDQDPVGFGHVAVGLVALALVALLLLRPWASSTDDGASAPAPASPEADPADPLRDQQEIRFDDLPAYEGVAFAAALEAEQRALANALVVDEVTGLAVPDHEGTYTNVADGVRASLAPTCACPLARVWLVGGSAAFGLGQRDDRTIASELVRRAEDAGIALEVTNLAVPGWTTWQEVAAVRQRLASGAARPDAILSFGGYNDAVAALVGSVVHDGEVPEPLALSPDDIATFANGERSVDDLPGGSAGVVEAQLERSRAELQAMQDLADAAGAELVVAFQPDALASPDQFEPVAEVYRALPASVVPDLDAVLEGLSTGLAPEVHDLRDLYDAEPTSVFVDWVHTNERGAALAAEALWPLIEPAVASAAS